MAPIVGGSRAARAGAQAALGSPAVPFCGV